MTFQRARTQRSFECDYDRKTFVIEPAIGTSVIKLRLISAASGPAVVRIAIKDESFLIGRDKHADLKLKCESASRRHSLIVSDSETATILDLGSRNGTIVNGERLKLGQTMRLQHKDLLQFGTDAFRVSMRDAETGEPVSLEEPPVSQQVEGQDAAEMFSELDRLVDSNQAESALDALDDSLTAEGDIDGFDAPKTIELDARRAQSALDDLIDFSDDD